MERRPSYFPLQGEADDGEAGPSSPRSAPYRLHGESAEPSDSARRDPHVRIAFSPDVFVQETFEQASPIQKIEETFQTRSEADHYDSTKLSEYPRYSTQAYPADPSVKYTPNVQKAKDTFQYLNQAQHIPLSDINLRPEYYKTAQYQTDRTQHLLREPSAPRGCDTNYLPFQSAKPVDLGGSARIPRGNDPETNPHNRDINVRLGLPTPSKTYLNPLHLGK